jgi:cobalt-zinc-cadmium efflux system outer membrane protein
MSRATFLRGATCRSPLGAAAWWLFLLTLSAASADAQSPADVPDSSRRPARSDGLDSVIARAIATSAGLRAESARARAARSRIAPAGARPDPMLMAGFRNVPLSSPSLSRDEMTMSMAGVSQTIPYRGKRPLRTRVARAEADAADARSAEVRLAVTRQVTEAYYTLAASRLVLEAVARQQQLAVALAPAVEARYTAGTAMQSDIVTTRSEIALLAQEGAGVAEEARAALGNLNALLDRPAEAPAEARIPDRVLRAALGDTTRPPAFASAVLGARLTDSPLLPTDSIVTLAVQRSPRVREHEALIAAQEAAAELAARDHLPDFDVSLEYGYRARRSDMISAVVSLPLPLQRRSKQEELALAARSELEAHEADHHAEITELRREVARLTSALERSRAQIALSRRAVIPQANAATQSATASYRAGRGEFVALLTTLRSTYSAETQYIRALQEFAVTLAELEALAGGEVLR